MTTTMSLVVVCLQTVQQQISQSQWTEVIKNAKSKEHWKTMASEDKYFGDFLTIWRQNV